jgi:hypothetical protein
LGQDVFDVGNGFEDGDVGQGREKVAIGGGGAPTSEGGDFEMGQLTGRGIYRYPNGDMFEGEVLNGVRQGPGYYLWSSGRLDLTAFQASKYAGNGVRWSAERDCAWRLVDGIETEAISLEQAEEERLVHEQLLADIVEAREKARAEAEEAAAAAAAAAAAGGGKKDDKKGKKK